MSNAILVAASLLSGLGSCETLWILSSATRAPHPTVLSGSLSSYISLIICGLMFDLASLVLVLMSTDQVSSQGPYNVDVLARIKALAELASVRIS